VSMYGQLLFIFGGWSKGGQERRRRMQYIGYVAEKYLVLCLMRACRMCGCNGANVTMMVGGAAYGLAVIA
jgi:hypothetical protein